jgi:hypothetical protein
MFKGILVNIALFVLGLVGIVESLVLFYRVVEMASSRASPTSYMILLIANLFCVEILVLFNLAVFILIPKGKEIFKAYKLYKTYRQYMR